MPARSAADFRGQAFPAFPKGGLVRPLVVSGETWTEFDPKEVDLFRVHVPDGTDRVVYTSTRNFPDLADGDVVTADHTAVAMPYRPGLWHDCYDRAGTTAPDGVRFFFALDDDTPGATATLLFEEAAE